MCSEFFIRKLAEYELANIYHVEDRELTSGWCLVYDAAKEVNVLENQYYKSLPLEEGYVYICSGLKLFGGPISLLRFTVYVDQVIEVHTELMRQFAITDIWECIFLLLDVIHQFHDGDFIIAQISWLYPHFQKVSTLLMKLMIPNPESDGMSDSPPSSIEGTCTRPRRAAAPHQEEEFGARELDTPPTTLALLS